MMRRGFLPPREGGPIDESDLHSEKAKAVQFVISRLGATQWLEHINQAKPFSNRSCRKTTIGSRSQRSLRRSDWPWLLESPVSRDHAWSESKCPLAPMSSVSEVHHCGCDRSRADMAGPVAGTIRSRPLAVIRSVVQVHIFRLRNLVYAPSNEPRGALWKRQKRMQSDDTESS